MVVDGAMPMGHDDAKSVAVDADVGATAPPRRTEGSAPDIPATRITNPLSNEDRGFVEGSRAAAPHRAWWRCGGVGRGDTAASGVRNPTPIYALPLTQTSWRSQAPVSWV